MKAITCPQCGSLIRHILPRQPIAECDYCGAKIITDEQSATPEPFDHEAAKFRALENYVQPRTPTQPIFIAVSVVGIFMFLMFLISIIPAKSTPVAPSPPEPFKPIIFPMPAPTIKKISDNAAIEFDGNGIGRVVIPKRVKRRLR